MLRSRLLLWPAARRAPLRGRRAAHAQRSRGPRATYQPLIYWPSFGLSNLIATPSIFGGPGTFATLGVNWRLCVIYTYSRGIGDKFARGLFPLQYSYSLTEVSEIIVNTAAIIKNAIGDTVHLLPRNPEGSLATSTRPVPRRGSSSLITPLMARAVSESKLQITHRRVDSGVIEGPRLRQTAARFLRDRNYLPVDARNALNV
ncbi:unnamed protein product, partial [Iphiclides podalirius]